MDWKPISEIPGYEDYTNYEMNQQGVLRNVKTGRDIKWTSCEGNYWYFQAMVYNNYEYKVVKQHRALACLFIPNPHNLPFVDHKNGKSTDNRLVNLRWCTRIENNINLATRYNSTSGYKNISPTTKCGKPIWQIQVQYNGKRKSANFPRDTDDVPEHVIAKRNEMLREYHGNFARI